MIGRWMNTTLKNQARRERPCESPHPLQGGFFILVLTSRCNFACRHCMRNMGRPKDLPFEIIEKAVTSGLRYQFRYLSLTGGEPLVYPRFGDVLELAVKNDCGFNIVTNGYLLHEFSDLLIKVRKNLHFIQFSLEDIDKAGHDRQRHPGSFDRLMQAFQFCREHKIPFVIATATSTANVEKIFDIALFAKKKGAASLFLSTVLPCPRAADNHLVLNAEQRKDLLAAAPRIARILKFPVSTTMEVHGTGNRVEFCSSLNLVGITIDPDGHIARCCILANFDDAETQRQTVIASLKDKSFDEALAMTLEHHHRFFLERIKDFQQGADTAGIDFNSCFYCLNKLSGGKKP